MTASPKKILMVHADKGERGELAIMLARFGHCVAFVNALVRFLITNTEFYGFKLDRFVDFDYK
jgi:hypothetical protein